jgi:hypothetical protein
MRSAFRHGAIVLALVGVIGLMAAHRFGSELDATDEPLGPTFPDDETTGSIDRSTPPGWIQLSDDQRGWIFLGVMNLPDVTEARIEAPSQAAALPDTVDLFDLPAMVTRKIPLLRDYRFVKLDDRILVVRPGDRRVVMEIPRYRLLP